MKSYIVINSVGRTVEVEDEVVKLTPKEFLMLEVILNFSYGKDKMDLEHLIQYVWMDRYRSITANNVSQLFSRVRKKLYNVSGYLDLKRMPNGMICAIIKDGTEILWNEKPPKRYLLITHIYNYLKKLQIKL